jgi:hypothetical protein
MSYVVWLSYNDRKFLEWALDSPSVGKNMSTSLTMAIRAL